MKKPFKCPFCWNRYGYEHSRNLHIKEDHRNLIQHAKVLKDFSDMVQIKVRGLKLFLIRKTTYRQITCLRIAFFKPVSKRLEKTSTVILPSKNFTIIRTDSMSTDSYESKKLSNPESPKKQMQIEYHHHSVKEDPLIKPIRVPVITVNPYAKTTSQYENPQFKPKN